MTRDGAEEEMRALEDEEEEVRVGLGGMLRIAKDERARISSSSRGEEGDWIGRIGMEREEMGWSSEGVE